MGLSGTLEAFPLSEVLRLLVRSGQTGRLFAQGGTKEMRAYLQGGKLVVAWHGTDDAFGEELVARGLLAPESWADIESGALPCEEGLQEGVSPLDFDKAVLDLTVEGLAKMVDGRSGTFAFEEGEITKLRLSTELELDAVLEGVNERLNTWRRLRSIVPDTAETLVFELAVAGERVELSHVAWNLLVSLLPMESLDALVARTGRSSTVVIEEMVELLEGGWASIEGFIPPAALEPEEEQEQDLLAERDEHIAMVGEDPLGGVGPTGWENELLSIPAVEQDQEAEDDSIPLLGDDEAPFLAGSGDDPEGFDFGLVGLDVSPSKGRNLLEKDQSWGGFGDFLGADELEEEEAPEPVSEAAVEEEAPPVDSGPKPKLDLGLSDDETFGTVMERLDEVLAEPEPEPASEPAMQPEAESELEPSPEPEPDSADDGDVDELIGAFTEARGSVEDEEVEPAEGIGRLSMDIEAAEEDEPEAEPLVEEFKPVGEPTLYEPVAEDDGGVEAEASVDDIDELASVLSRLDLDGEDETPDDVDDVIYSAPDSDELSDEIEAEEEDAPEGETDLPYDEGVVTDSDEEVTDDVSADEDDGEQKEEERSDRELPNLLRRRSRGALAKELRSLSD